MEKKHKILAGVGIAFLLLGFVYLRRKKKQREEINAPLMESTPEQISNLPLDSTVVALYPPTPFKVQKAGDTFRTWVNKWHPDYAKEIDLDPKGKIDNSYIRKAWQKYGQEYINAGGKI